MRPPGDAALVEVLLDDARGGHELGVARDGAGDPVDVRRLERRDVTERVPVELAELDDVLSRAIEAWRLGPAEVADPATLERSGGRRGARLLLASTLGPESRLSPKGAAAWVFAPW